MYAHCPFGSIGNIDVDLFTLKNSGGMELSLTNYGGTVTSIKFPLQDETLQELVLGFDNLDDYRNSTHFLGATIGRYANRIAAGRFTLAGREYCLAQNNGGHHLHGGARGFDKVVWEAVPVYADSRTGIQLSYLSQDGEEGYPGNLQVQVVYWLTEGNELIINYQAETDQETVVCLTHHSYFNLSRSKTIKDHLLMIDADHFTPVSLDLIPTGELSSVTGTICDLREQRELGPLLESQDRLLLAGGYDHNFVLSTDSDGLCAKLFAPDTGVQMEMFTSEPGVQLYTGNFLHEDAKAVSKRFPQHSGLCLEAQHFPNSPNCLQFPTVILKPGEKYQQSTRYSFANVKSL